MKYFPLFVDLKDKPVLVVGAGQVARRKISLLLKTKVRLLVVAKHACEAVTAWHKEGKLQYVKDQFRPRYLAGQWLVFAATNDHAVHQVIRRRTIAKQILLNVVDDKALSQCIMPAIVDRDPLQIAISTGGEAPVLARVLRAALEVRLPSALGNLAKRMGRWRSTVKRKLPRPEQRRRFWERVLVSSVPEHIVQMRQAEADAELLRLLNDDRVRVGKGSVSLVGAGPGDPELLTLKALHKLQAADMVFYDSLVSDAVMALVRRDAELVYVGKQPEAHSCEQEAIQTQLVQAARQGKQVVRLKGGDPFIFGRGGEELEALTQAGIEFDVVPGITAAAAAAAYAGIPLTHRDYAHAAILATGHGKNAQAPDWSALAKSKQTLAVYMGVKQSAMIARQLIQHGRQPHTPVVVVERASMPGQRYFSGVLDELPQLVQDHSIQPPAVILIGEVCQLAGRYDWAGIQTTLEESTRPKKTAVANAI